MDSLNIRTGETRVYVLSHTMDSLDIRTGETPADVREQVRHMLVNSHTNGSVSFQNVHAHYTRWSVAIPKGVQFLKVYTSVYR